MDPDHAAGFNRSQLIRIYIVSKEGIEFGKKLHIMCLLDRLWYSLPLIQESQLQNTDLGSFYCSCFTISLS